MCEHPSNPALGNAFRWAEGDVLLHALEGEILIQFLETLWSQHCLHGKDELILTPSWK